MEATLTVKVDVKGRLTIPQPLRKALGIEPGDIFFVALDETHKGLRYEGGEPFRRSRPARHHRVPRRTNEKLARLRRGAQYLSR
jgi:AbrB family looped-hinge helix DNA binding protein